MTGIKVTAIGAPRASTSTSEAFALGDETTGLTLNNTGGITLTLPQNSSINFPVGVTLLYAQAGAGQVTLSYGSPVTVFPSDKLKTRTKGSLVTLWQVATNIWFIGGDLTS